MRNFIFQIVKFFQGGSIYDTTLNVSKNRRDFTENQAVHSSAQCGKTRIFSLKILCQINSFVISFISPLLSRIFFFF